MSIMRITSIHGSDDFGPHLDAVALVGEPRDPAWLARVAATPDFHAVLAHDDVQPVGALLLSTNVDREDVEVFVAAAAARHGTERTIHCQWLAVEQGHGASVRRDLVRHAVAHYVAAHPAGVLATCWIGLDNRASMVTATRVGLQPTEFLSAGRRFGERRFWCGPVG